MNKASLVRRVARLEAAKSGGEFTLGELVWWSFHRELCLSNNPDYVEANLRFMKSRLRQNMPGSYAIIAL
jgi:hypothetical protein